MQSCTEHTADHGERIGFPDWRIRKGFAEKTAIEQMQPPRSVGRLHF